MSCWHMYEPWAADTCMNLMLSERDQPQRTSCCMIPLTDSLIDQSLPGLPELFSARPGFWTSMFLSALSNFCKNSDVSLARIPHPVPSLSTTVSQVISDHPGPPSGRILRTLMLPLSHFLLVGPHPAPWLYIPTCLCCVLSWPRSLPHCGFPSQWSL